MALNVAEILFDINIRYLRFSTITKYKSLYWNIFKHIANNAYFYISKHQSIKCHKDRDIFDFRLLHL